MKGYVCVPEPAGAGRGGGWGEEWLNPLPRYCLPRERRCVLGDVQVRRVCASGGAHSKVLPPAAGREVRAAVAAGEATRCAIVEARTGAGAAAVGAF